MSVCDDAYQLEQLTHDAHPEVRDFARSMLAEFEHACEASKRKTYHPCCWPMLIASTDEEQWLQRIQSTLGY